MSNIFEPEVIKDRDVQLDRPGVDSIQVTTFLNWLKSNDAANLSIQRGEPSCTPRSWYV